MWFRPGWSHLVAAVGEVFPWSWLDGDFFAVPLVLHGTKRIDVPVPVTFWGYVNSKIKKLSFINPTRQLSGSGV